jgi:hypothetical protein
VQSSSDMQERPDVSAEERAWIERVKRIRKLRWVGMIEEAERMEVAVRGVEPAPMVPADTRDTE